MRYHCHPATRTGSERGRGLKPAAPKYCDVIIQRWQNFSGGHATLEGDGRTLEQIKTARLGVVA